MHLVPALFSIYIHKAVHQCQECYNWKK